MLLSVCNLGCVDIIHLSLLKARLGQTFHYQCGSQLLEKDTMHISVWSLGEVYKTPICGFSAGVRYKMYV